jgi:periplasmic protein TonB
MLSITTLRRRDHDADAADLGWAMAWSTFAHLTVVAALLIGGVRIGSIESAAAARPRSSERVPYPQLVFLAPPAVLDDGKGGGGGGGGNRMAPPIRRAESVGRDPYTLRVAKPAGTSGRLVDAPPLPAPALDATPLASGMFNQVGLPTGGTTLGTSTGPGSGGGVGDGIGTGIGSGRGPGIGSGSGGGTGGGVYRPGGIVTAPSLLMEVRPSYTADALHRRIQGSVELELVVTPEGAASHIRVVQSLDPGLDMEAMNAVQRWKFAPGRRAGVAVNVLVTAILDFTIR